MSVIHIFRHGETEWNVKEILQGQKNSPLSVQGREQAVAAREKLQGIEFDAVYSSPSSRAVDTAEIMLAGKDLKVVTL